MPAPAPAQADPAIASCTHLLQHFDPRSPLLVGGIARGEEGQGYMQLRLKRHRWFPKILKNRDPLVFRWVQALVLCAATRKQALHRARGCTLTAPHLCSIG